MSNCLGFFPLKRILCSSKHMVLHITQIIISLEYWNLNSILFFSVIAKHMQWGRQEDAHEFLRYVIDAMQKSVLHGYSK